MRPHIGQNVAEIRNLPGAVGLRVRALRAFMGVPVGTEGIIDEHYRIGEAEGVTVAWDLPTNPLPSGYSVYDGLPMMASGILRDGFGRREFFDETRFLLVVGVSVR